MSEEVKIGLCDGEGNPVASVEQSRTPNGDSHRRVFCGQRAGDGRPVGAASDTFRLGESFVPSPVSLRFGYEEIARFLAFLQPVAAVVWQTSGWLAPAPPSWIWDCSMPFLIPTSNAPYGLIDQGANVNALDKDGNSL